MGSDQSSSAGRKNRQKEQENGKRLSVTSNRQYEHLTCNNDNSARSSPSDVHSLKGGKRSPSTRICLCFRCINRNEEHRRKEDPVCGHNGDSVALLRVSSRSSFRASELEGDGNSFPQKSEQLDGEYTQERLGDVIVVQENLDDCVVETSEFVVSGADSLYAQPSISPQSSVLCNGNVSTAESESELSPKHKKEFVVSKKYLSFPFGLFSRSKPRPSVDSSGFREVTQVKGENLGRKKSAGRDADCMSNETSYEDSGKASESDFGQITTESERKITKAPIAKIDSLETTSLDSLNSEDLMLDITSTEDLRKKRSVEAVKESVDDVSQVCKSQNISRSFKNNPCSVEEKSLDRTKQNCLSEPKLNERHLDVEGKGTTAPGGVTPCFSTSGPGEILTRRNCSEVHGKAATTVPGISERKRYSCPSAGTQFVPFVYYDNQHPVFSDFKDDARAERDAVLEMPNQRQPADEDIVVLDNGTYSGFVKEIDSCRAMLMELSSLLSQDEVDNKASLDLSIAVENENLRKQVISLETLVREQQELITSLEMKLALQRNVL